MKAKCIVFLTRKKIIFFSNSLLSQNFIMLNYLTSKRAGLLSNSQVNKQPFDRLILICHWAAKKPSAFRHQGTQTKDTVWFHSWNLHGFPTSKTSHHRYNLSNIFHFFLVIKHAPQICLTSVPQPLFCKVQSIDVNPYPRRPVLDPCSGHFLLVDDVHELDGIVALHIHHRPFQRILGNLVELETKKIW